MRNLKRALSLALATVMTVGMMVVGTGASYADVKATDNVEAIEVLQAVGIMTGDENGDFNPDANVTRNEIAVIMSNLLNLDYDYYRGTNPFTDVPSWAAPYVAACYAEGVTAGAGNGLYNGAGNVTAAEASLMIMKALGYSSTRTTSAMTGRSPPSVRLPISTCLMASTPTLRPL